MEWQPAYSSRFHPWVSPREDSLRFQRFLLRRRKQLVGQDVPIAWRILDQTQICRRIADRVLRIFGSVAAVVRPGALAVVTVDVLHPRRALFVREDHVARLEHRLVEARRHAEEV